MNRSPVTIGAAPQVLLWQHLQVLQDYGMIFEKLQTVGRNGTHRYKNKDYSMLTASLAAKNILGEDHDLWNVNVERSYLKNFTDEEWSRRHTQATSGGATYPTAVQELAPATSIAQPSR